MRTEAAIRGMLTQKQVSSTEQNGTYCRVTGLQVALHYLLVSYCSLGDTKDFLKAQPNWNSSRLLYLLRGTILASCHTAVCLTL